MGMPFHNYTGVLIGATAIPVWNNRIRSLPREFGIAVSNPLSAFSNSPGKVTAPL